MISLIVALSEPTYAIGKSNKLLWNIPDDMEHFKRTTKRHNVIMGRNTWESIPKKFRPLPDRCNIVLSSTMQSDEVLVLPSLDEALEHCKGNAFIIGGASVYKEALKKDILNTMYITYINQVVEGDTHFPRFDKSQWSELFLGQGEHKNWSYRFMHYRRNK